MRCLEHTHTHIHEFHLNENIFRSFFMHWMPGSSRTNKMCNKKIMCWALCDLSMPSLNQFCFFRFSFAPCLPLSLWLRLRLRLRLILNHHPLDAKVKNRKCDRDAVTEHAFTMCILYHSHTHSHTDSHLHLLQLRAAFCCQMPSQLCNKQREIQLTQHLYAMLQCTVRINH